MKKIELFDYQQRELDATRAYNRVAYYHDMGLGKTFTGSVKMDELGSNTNIVICQLSKVDDWVAHFQDYFSDKYTILNLRKKKELDYFWNSYDDEKVILVGNYDSFTNKDDFLELEDYTLMLDESSIISNETSKRSRFMMKLKFKNIILLSGTPVSGKYEKLWSQCHFLGWNISKKLFWKHYVDIEWQTEEGYPRPVIAGYKNVERLKKKIRDYGARFLKTEEVFELPKQNFIEIKVPCSKAYYHFMSKSVITIKDHIGEPRTFVGDNSMAYRIGLKMLSGVYSKSKMDAYRDLLCSTGDRIIVFYNYNEELDALQRLTTEYIEPSHISVVNGKGKNLEAYEQYNDSVTFIQYQAGARGLNLQKATKIIYFSPVEWSELYEQSKKRIHRIGQDQPCFYYLLTSVGKNSIDMKIYENLKERRDYTDILFEQDFNKGGIG